MCGWARKKRSKVCEAKIVATAEVSPEQNQFVYFDGAINPVAEYCYF